MNRIVTLMLSVVCALVFTMAVNQKQADAQLFRRPLFKGQMLERFRQRERVLPKLLPRNWDFQFDFGFGFRGDRDRFFRESPRCEPRHTPRRGKRLSPRPRPRPQNERPQDVLPDLLGTGSEIENSILGEK